MENKNKIRNLGALYRHSDCAAHHPVAGADVISRPRTMKYSEIVTYFPQIEQVTDFQLDLGSGEMRSDTQ